MFTVDYSNMHESNTAKLHLGFIIIRLIISTVQTDKQGTEEANIF